MWLMLYALALLILGIFCDSESTEYKGLSFSEFLADMDAHEKRLELEVKERDSICNGQGNLVYLKCNCSDGFTGKDCDTLTSFRRCRLGGESRVSCPERYFCLYDDWRCFKSDCANIDGWCVPAINAHVSKKDEPHDEQPSENATIVLKRCDVEHSDTCPEGYKCLFDDWRCLFNNKCPNKSGWCLPFHESKRFTFFGGCYAPETSAELSIRRCRMSNKYSLTKPCPDDSFCLYDDWRCMFGRDGECYSKKGGWCFPTVASTANHAANVVVEDDDWIAFSRLIEKSGSKLEKENPRLAIKMQRALHEVLTSYRLEEEEDRHNSTIPQVKNETEYVEDSGSGESPQLVESLLL